ncbi:ankyrin [Tothia fuscella]|uniref:Ankyrin n=1 Tax=Tothia fuscella TaxID=1048955 RepID=A0A9P4NMP6_9PEZI|nr:ankyrin [Tothia fuscella]
MAGNLTLIESIIEREVDVSRQKSLVNEANASGDTPVLLACKSGHAAVVMRLLDAKADAGISNIHNENGLHWFSSFDPKDIFEIAWALVQNGARLHQTAEDITAGPELTLMSKQNANLFHRLNPGTPLHRAVGSANMDAIVSLLNLGADPTFEFRSTIPLCRAANLRRPDILETLLGFTPCSFDINSLYAGILSKSGKRNVSILQRAIIAPKAQVHYKSYQPYVDTLLVETVRLLLRAGIKGATSPSAPHAVDLCIWRRENAALELPLDHKPSSALWLPELENGMAMGPLFLSNATENEQAFDSFVDAGTPIDSVLRFGTTAGLSALHQCVKDLNQNTGLARRLLDMGIDVNAIFDHEASDTALLYALQSSNFDHAELLVAYGATLTAESPSAIRGNVMGELLNWDPVPMLLRAL